MVIFMKKRSYVLLFILGIIIFLSGCMQFGTAQPANNSAQPANGAAQPADARNNAANSKDSAANASPITYAAAGDVINYTMDDAAVDIDFTVLSSMMVFAEFYNIMLNPDDFVGKIIKMNGLYYASVFDKDDYYSHYITVGEGDACCAQGFEFKWNGEHKFPDDYPKENTKIELTGAFSKYEKLGRTHYYLAVDNIAISK